LSLRDTTKGTSSWIPLCFFGAILGAARILR
jgi:hypothetical protein